MPRSLARTLVPFPSSVRRRWSAAEARAILDRLDSSGLSVREFAARAQLGVQRLYRWRAQLGSGLAARPAFVEIKPKSVATIEVVLRSGHVLRVPEGFGEESLRRAGSRCSTSGDRDAEPAAQRPAVRGDAASGWAQGRRQLDGHRARYLRTRPTEWPPVHLLFEALPSVSARFTGIATASRCGPSRLESGRFRPAFSSDGRLTTLPVEAAELALIVEGIDLAGAHRRRRWQPGKAA